MKLAAFFSLDADVSPDGRIGLTQKIVEGLAETAAHWPGEMVAVFAPRTSENTNLDQVWLRPEAMPVRPMIVAAGSPESVDVIRDADLVQIGVDYRHTAVARTCRSLGVPYVVVAEYSLRTRLQIAAVEEKRVLRRLRRSAWELVQEVKLQRAIAGAAGLQCNGTPTYEAWSGLCPSSLLYFDSRVQPAMLATADDVQRRGRGHTLELAFSGRLIPMKGVQHLPGVARHLKDIGIPFRMRIWGGGSSAPALRARIGELGLEHAVTLEGTLPFAELMAEVRTGVDLFVSPHVQGDPSCTYLETLACGVPIAGFDNDAWRGVRRHSDAGWAAPVADDRALAGVIAHAHTHRDELRTAAARGLQFAREHTADVTFARRVEHLQKVAAARGTRRRPA